MLEVIVGHEPGVAAGGGVRCGEDLEVVGCPWTSRAPGRRKVSSARMRMKLAVLQVLLVVRGLVAAHRP